MKRIYTIVALVGLACASAAAWWLQNRSNGSPLAVGVADPKAPSKDGAGASPGAGAAGASGGAAPAAAVRPGGGPAGTGGGPAGGGPAPVEVAKAEATTLTDDIQAVGSLKSERGVMLRPEVSGRISKLFFSDGGKVQRGQLLVQLDDTLQQAQMKQAEAQAGIARTRLQRNRELLGQGFVSQSAVDQSVADLQVAEAQVALAQAQVSRMKVLAPFNGTAGLRKVDEGDYVKDGADLVNVEDLSAITVQFALPERTIDRLRVGQSIDLTLDALPGRAFKGRVSALDSEVDANGRALQVLARVDNPGALLKPGMFARPRVVFATRPNAVVVPEEALVPQGARQLIFKVVEGADGKKVAQRLEVKIGLRLPGQVEVMGGLAPGDSVVTAGHGRLLRGENLPVRVVDLSKPGAGRSGGKSGGPGGTVAGASAGAAGGPSASAATLGAVPASGAGAAEKRTAGTAQGSSVPLRTTSQP